MSHFETDELGSLPLALKLVLKIFEYEGRFTNQEISDQSWLSKRTVRTALQRLEHANFIKKGLHEDARKNWHELKSTIEMRNSD